MAHNVERLEMLLERERIAKRICAELNHFTDLRPVLTTIIENIKQMTGCEAVSIRLHDDGDYPYFEYNGFPESFIRHENSLCSRDRDGERIPCPDGEGYLLDCMCGNVIRGRFDASQPFFTAHGSFWANVTSELLADTTEEDRQGRTRNYCNSCGYESVALVPIVARGERIGLIQLNDTRRDMFTLELIEYLEMIGEQIGLAVHNSLVHEHLKQALDEIVTLRGIIPICASCKKVRNDEGYWEDVAVYIRNHSEADFSHGVCPDCMRALYPKYADQALAASD